MWHDNETTEDLLGFDQFVDAIITLVQSPDLLPITIGIFGDWGGGKSSLMGMASKVLGGEKQYLYLNFNSWQFEGYDDIKAALMASVMQALKDNEETIGLKAKELLGKLVKRVDWFRAVGLAGKHLFTLTPPSLEEVTACFRPAETGDDNTQTIIAFR